MDDEEEKIIKNMGLIHYAIKKKNIKWSTEDEHQEYVDAGIDGLIKGIRTYDETKNAQPSTYYYTCICNEFKHLLCLKNVKKRKGKVVSLDAEVGDDYLIDFIPSNVNVEKEVEDKIRNEKLLEMINSLPIEKDIFVIKAYFGLDGYDKLSSVKLAKLMGVNKNRILERKNRALNLLWLKIKKEGL